MSVRRLSARIFGPRRARLRSSMAICVTCRTMTTRTFRPCSTRRHRYGRPCSRRQKNPARTALQRWQRSSSGPRRPVVSPFPCIHGTTTPVGTSRVRPARSARLPGLGACSGSSRKRSSPRSERLELAPQVCARCSARTVSRCTQVRPPRAVCRRRAGREPGSRLPTTSSAGGAVFGLCCRLRGIPRRHCSTISVSAGSFA